MAFAGLNGQSTYRAVNSLACPRRAFPTPARISLKTIPAIAFSVRFPTHEIRSSLAILKFIKSLRFHPQLASPRGFAEARLPYYLQMRKLKFPLQIHFLKLAQRPALTPPGRSWKKSNRKKGPEPGEHRRPTASWGPAGVRAAILARPPRGRPKPPGSQSEWFSRARP